MRRAPLLLALFAIVSCDSREAIPKPQPSGPALVVGRVVDAQNQPVAGAVVLAASQHDQLAWPLDAPALEDEGLNALRVVTDATGRFRFEGLNSGLAQFSLRAKGFALRELRRIALDTGIRTDLGDVRLQNAAQVSGTVLSFARTPVVGAAVLYMQPENSAPHAHALTGVLVAHTDSRGAFRITQLEPGPFTLAIDAPGEAPFRVSGIATDELALGEVVLPAPSTISGIVRSFPLGELSDLEIVTIPVRATPFVRRPGVEGGRHARWLEGLQRATIGEYGGFLFTELKSNCDYTLRVIAPSDALRVTDVWSPPKLVRSGTEDVVVTAHPSVRMDFRVVDAYTHNPIDEFKHTWLGARSLPRNGVDYLRATNDSRRVQLRVSARGYEDYESKPLALVTGNSLTPFVVELTPGETQSENAPSQSEQPVNWIATLPGFEPRRETRDDEPERGRGILTGTIRVEADALAGAVLRLFPLRERDAFFAARDDAIQVGRTDRNGRFQLFGVPPGEHILAIAHKSRAQLTLHIVLAGEVNLDLDNHTLHGRVVAADGSPVAKAKIHLPQHWKREARFEAALGDRDQNVIAWRELRTPPVVAITDSAGRFTLTGLESGNALTLGARSAHHGVGTLRLASLEQEATILLSSNSTLTVDGVDSRPLERALGVAWRWGRDYGHEIRFAYTRPLNREFRGLSADEWTVFHANLNGWGEASSMRILAPVLLDPVGDSRVRIHH